MALIQATDVVLMGWLGPRQLAASALGLNLTFAFSLICLGLVTASSPMMATAIGHKTQSVHEVRRTFRQSLWMIVTVMVPIWLVLWNSEPIILALTYGKGRVFHDTLGHVGPTQTEPVASMNSVDFITLLQRGTEWAATGAVTIPVPADFPTKDKTSVR